MPKNVVCKKCNNLANDWCEKVIDSPDQDMQRDCQYFCEKTNADKIREMSDEDLAEWLTEFANEAFAAGAIRFGGALMTEHDRLTWLKQSAKEGER